MKLNLLKIVAFVMICSIQVSSLLATADAQMILSGGVPPVPGGTGHRPLSIVVLKSCGEYRCSPFSPRIQQMRDTFKVLYGDDVETNVRVVPVTLDGLLEVVAEPQGSVDLLILTSDFRRDFHGDWRVEGGSLGLESLAALSLLAPHEMAVWGTLPGENDQKEDDARDILARIREPFVTPLSLSGVFHQGALEQE